MQWLLQEATDDDELVPPPCNGFSFTKIDHHRAVLFGGESDAKEYIDDVYILDLAKMVRLSC